MARPSETLRFTRLRLTNWRNFKEVDLRLQDRNFVVGPNGGGKSNLLDAIRFFSDLVRPVGGGLQAALDSRQGFRSVRCLHRTGTKQFVELHAVVGTSANPSRWEYRLRFDMPGHERLAAVAQEVIVENGAVREERVRAPADERRRFSQTLIEQAEKAHLATALIDFSDRSATCMSCRRSCATVSAPSPKATIPTAAICCAA